MRELIEKAERSGSAEEWWNKSTACFVWAVKVGHGARQLWTEFDAGRQKNEDSIQVHKKG